MVLVTNFNDPDDPHLQAHARGGSPVIDRLVIRGLSLSLRLLEALIAPGRKIDNSLLSLRVSLHNARRQYLVQQQARERGVEAERQRRKVFRALRLLSPEEQSIYWRNADRQVNMLFGVEHE